MEQTAKYVHALEPNTSWGTTEVKRPRPLTYDEKKAAEAAFRGAPLNPAWSLAARQVYEGIFDTMIRMGIMWISPLEENLSE